MYPAPALVAELFTWEDLPDTIIYRLNSGDLTYNKLSPPVEAFDGLVYYQEEASGPIGSGEENVIFIQSGDGEDSRWKTIINAAAVDGGRECLISPIDAFVKDDFADTYTVEKRTDGIGQPVEATFTITRESLCRWCGFDPQLQDTICLEYIDPRLAPPGEMWFMGVFGEASPRNLKSPAGNYSDGGTIWTVVEP
jgi:hypothetical protein